MNHLPFDALMELKSGVIDEASQVINRRLSDMPSFFHDQDAVQAQLEEDPVLYRTYIKQSPISPSLWSIGSSVIEPGTVGNEYFMTKGHFHLKEEAPEVYFTVSGSGRLLLQRHSGEAEVKNMAPGVINYIPGGWAHRTVNVGEKPLIFFAVWPADAGHNYGAIEEMGFTKLVVDDRGVPKIIDNPKSAPGLGK